MLYTCRLLFSHCPLQTIDLVEGLSTKIYYSLLYGSHDRNKSLVRSKYLFVLSHWSGTDLHVKFKTYYGTFSYILFLSRGKKVLLSNEGLNIYLH